MTNRAAFFARSIQWSSSTVMVMMSSMKLSIDASVAVISTAKGSAFDRWLADCCFSSVGIKDLCGELRSLCPRIDLEVDRFLGLLPLH